MASQGEEDRPESEYYHDDEGGPVKSFLEHLEDLRWVLIKCVVGIAILMLVCLIAANQVLAIVTWPLKRADKHRKPPGTELLWLAGTNLIASGSPGTNFLHQLGVTNQNRLAFDLVPKLVGSNLLLTVDIVTNDTRLDSIKPRGTVTVLRNLSPVGGFWVAFQIALYGGIVFAAPYLIYVIGGFVLPALKLKERKYVLRGFAIGSGLFMMGVFFCYFFLMPMALRASFQYSEWLGFAADEWRAEDYISFVCKFMLGMGLGFELPVVVLTLVKIGVVDYAKLKAARRYMIVINLFLGAILTTPEVITQVLMFIPLQGLYELSIWIAGYWERDAAGKRRARINLALVILGLVGLIIWLSYRFNFTREKWLNFLIG
jgi:sec-independent protein translocase protein TatC